MNANKISFRAAHSACAKAAYNRPGYATYDLVVVGSGHKRPGSDGLFDLPYFAQRREIAAALGNAIVFDPMSERFSG